MLAIALLVSAFAVLPLVFVASAGIQAGFPLIAKLVFRPRVAELLYNTLLLIALTVLGRPADQPPTRLDIFFIIVAGFVAGTLVLIGGSSPAFALDPGEYARVHVDIQPGQWHDLQPGEHELHAILVDLGVRTAEPLRIMLSDAEIEANRPAQRTSPPSVASQQEALRSRLELLRALGSVRRRLHEITDIIMDSPDRDAARARIEALLECTAEAAGAVLALSLQSLVHADQDRIADEIRELERELESEGEPPLS